MSTTTLQFKFRLGGVLTDATSIVLSDATGTYGVRRTDTLATVVNDGTAMTHPSTGVYEYTFTDPAAGLTYQWVAEVLRAGNTSRYTFTATGGGGDAYEGRYVTEVELGVALDNYNLTAYTDLDNDGARDSGAVERVIKGAEGRVDLYTGGPFTFSDGLNGEVAGGNFTRWAQELAVDLAVNKRVPVTSDAGRALAERVAGVIKEMQMFAAGSMLLPGAIPANGPLQEDAFVFDAVEAVGPTVNPDGTTLNTYPILTVNRGQLNYG